MKYLYITWITFAFCVLGSVGCGPKLESESNTGDTDRPPLVDTASETASWGDSQSAFETDSETLVDTGTAIDTGSVIDTGSANDTATVTDSGTETDTETESETDTYVPQFDVLLDAGHVNDLAYLALWQDRILSADRTRWILWDTVSQTRIVQQSVWNDGTDWEKWRADISIACTESEEMSCYDDDKLEYVDAPPWISIIENKNGKFLLKKSRYENAEWKYALEVRSFDTGELTGEIAVTGSESTGLARDGSYIWTASSDSIRIWSPAGGLLHTIPGDYSKVYVLAMTEQLSVFKAISNANQLEHISISDGSRSLSSAFRGTFHSWFSDAALFFAVESSIIRVYDTDANQIKVLPLPSEAATLSGYKDCILSVDRNILNIIWLETGTVKTVSFPTYFKFIGKFNDLVALKDPGNDLGRLVLVHINSDETPWEYIDVPHCIGLTTAVKSDGKLAVSDSKGRIAYFSLADSSQIDYFGYGSILDIRCASTGKVAIVTTSGIIPVVDNVSLNTDHVFNFTNENRNTGGYGDPLIADLSDDGTTYTIADHFKQGGRSLKIYDVETEEVIYALDPSDSSQRVSDVSLSKDGKTVGITVCDQYGSSECDALLVELPEGTTTLLDSVAATIHLNATGEYAVVGDRIFQNGTLSSAVSGTFLGWLDSDHFLTTVGYTDPDWGTYRETATHISDADGVLGTALSLLIETMTTETFYPINSNLIYIPTPYVTGSNDHTIWDISGSTAVKHPWPDRQRSSWGYFSRISGVAGSAIVHIGRYGHQVLSVPFEE